jgi:cobalt-zinc-cadmium efflux system membrane fusion protein
VKNCFKSILTPVLLSILLAGCDRNETKTVSSDSAVHADGLEITADQMKSLKTVCVNTHTIPTIEEATGKVAFNEDTITPVYSPYAGRVLELRAKPGDFIAKGAPLLIIDSPEVVDAENDFLSGRAAVAKAEGILKQAERTRDRVQQLLAGEAAAPKDLEQAVTDLESARSDVRSAEAQIDSARQRLFNFGKTQAEIEQLALTRRADRTTRVMAPIAGQIVARKVGPGQYIRPDNPDPLFTISDTSTMWLLAQLYESQIPLVRLGERVQVRVLALPDQTYPAQVSYIAPSMDPATRRIAVRCVLRNRNNQLKPEMFASFRFEKPPRLALLVPQTAVVREGNIAAVWVVGGGNRLSRRPVELGEEINGTVEIKSGLRAGELIVADGALFLSSFVRG